MALLCCFALYHNIHTWILKSSYALRVRGMLVEVAVLLGSFEPVSTETLII